MKLVTQISSVNPCEFVEAKAWEKLQQAIHIHTESQAKAEHVPRPPDAVEGVSGGGTITSRSIGDGMGVLLQAGLMQGAKPLS